MYFSLYCTSQVLNINTTGINPAYITLPTHDVSGYETIYVECDCGEDKRKTLFENLKSSPSDAIKIQLHNDQQGISISICKHVFIRSLVHTSSIISNTGLTN